MYNSSLSDCAGMKEAFPTKETALGFIKNKLSTQLGFNSELIYSLEKVVVRLTGDSTCNSKTANSADTNNTGFITQIQNDLDSFSNNNQRFEALIKVLSELI